MLEIWFHIFFKVTFIEINNTIFTEIFHRKDFWKVACSKMDRMRTSGDELRIKVITGEIIFICIYQRNRSMHIERENDKNP